MSLPNNQPEYWMEDEDIEGLELDYSSRHPTDFVVSGPLPGGSGPGRAFDSWSAAAKWARERYGTRLRWAIREADTDDNRRWALLVRQA